MRAAWVTVLLTACSLAVDADAPDAEVVRLEAAVPAPDGAAGDGDDAAVAVADARPALDLAVASPRDAAPDPAPGCAAETCNGADDDCDGEVDEDFRLGTPCVVGLGRCERRGVRVCLGGADACDATPGVGREEVCDRVDDDCDGVVDEGAGDCCRPGERHACGPDVGACEAGEQVCGVGGTWGECIGAVGPEAEGCDGEDDDCDGAVDEGLMGCDPCEPGAQEARCDGIDDDCDGRTDEGLRNACGACGALPAEACNGVDDDCDGSVDEGVLNRCGRCGQLPREVCDGRDDDCDGTTDEGVVNACGACGPVPAEDCNGRDDDCDGTTDEGFANLGARCEAGVGACLRVGELRCDAAVDGVRCSAEAGAPGVEACGGDDEDCDGQFDEDLRCGCVDEVCNGEDDDCDDETDEGVLNACGGCGPVLREVCDGVDNDCDGQADEDFADLGSRCWEGVGACRRDGVRVCGRGAGTVCDAVPGDPRAELCNESDDDCDGVFDEGVVNACGQCGAVPEETCNGADDDCDGEVDEDFDLERDVDHCGRCGQRCVPHGDRCRQGQCQCGPFDECDVVCIAGRCDDFCGGDGNPCP